MSSETGTLIKHLVEQARLGDSYTRTEILKRVDKLIDFYIKERSAE